MVGAKIASEWRRLAAGGAEGLAVHGLPYVDNVVAGSSARSVDWD